MNEQLPLDHIEQERTAGGPVECLGMTFANDDERRQYFLAILAEKLKDPAFRAIEGFPIGTDEAILALSDPPYYTACPNPFLTDFIKYYGKPYDPNVPYSREPFAADVSEGKTDPLYAAHGYHTKVPHKAIMRYILHYTEPGDVVFDGFCGTGMTAVAAQLCGDRSSILELGYTVSNDGTIFENSSADDAKTKANAISRLGSRRVIANDLSPAATFIVANLASGVDALAFKLEATRLLKEIEVELGWMYETSHADGWGKGRVNFTVWSEVFACSACGKDIVFVDAAFDATSGSVRDIFPCPHCGAESSKDDLILLYESVFDQVLGEFATFPRRVPVLINYTVGDAKYEKKPDRSDLEVLNRVATMPFPEGMPMVKLPDMQMRRVGRMQPARITRVHHFFLPRSAHAVATAWKLAASYENTRIRHAMLFFVEQAIWTASLMNRFRPSGYSQVNQYLTGVFYIPSQHAECSPWYILGGKAERLARLFQEYVPVNGMTAISTQGLASLDIPSNSVDYVFTDPPFGENIYYSDLNFLIESWHQVWTATETEAIVDRVKEKTLLDYQRMMTECFRTYFRVLKPGRWITVEFHNSKNAVWSAIQEALQAAGFVVADIRILDKKQSSFQQVTSGGAVKQDLVISAYKPNGGLEDRFRLEGGTVMGVWDFVRTHLTQLPVFVARDGQAEVVVERLNYLLFDRMVAYHVQRGIAVPLSAAEFYAGLAQRFSERDGMYFLPEQAVEYDKKRMTTREVLQLQLFVTDEASAIQWLKQQLLKKPQTFQELHPQFLREIGGWQKHERPLELSLMLEQNFLRYDGEGEVPGQIHSYLSSNFKEFRNLPKVDVVLRVKARDRWYVPDPNKAGDLEKLRERALLREFWEYLPPGYKPATQQGAAGYLPGLAPGAKAIPQGKRVKVIRLEAVRSGFKLCWQNRDYSTIIAVAHRIPEDVLQEDPKLLMWYDQALTRLGGD